MLTPALRREADAGQFPADAWAALEEAGLPAALLPEDAGGFGAAPADALSLLRVAGAHALPLPLADTMLARWVLAQAGLDVPEGPLALPAGTDARLDKGRITGRAWAAPFARHAGHAVLLVDGHAALLPVAAATVEPGTDVAGDPLDALAFDAAVPHAPVALTPGTLRAAGAATRAILIAGAMEATVDATVRYATERSQFGKPIGRFQAVQQSLATLAGQAAAAGAAADAAAEHFTDPLRVAAVKARANEAAGIGAAIAHQVHGAIGFTEEHHLHRLTRRLWAWRDAWGTEAEWSALLGLHLAAAGPERLWEELTSL